MEGYRRNKFYLSHIISNYKPLLVFLQEHWLPQHEAHVKFESDFGTYKFITTSADMYTPIEERLLETGPVWHGSAIGWERTVDSDIFPLPLVNERFCGVKYKIKEQNLTLLENTSLHLVMDGIINYQ